ncbi:hypothetical protein ACQ4M4_25250 [Leptolyngbya sp. AN02str]|uniref:hypothetical protein n=1 Tax=Leptolyngbya sp. AN02str TaxID=3423363 RepID=UPI003D30F72F
MPITSVELTPNAIALLRTGTKGDRIERILLHCYSCNLYYCWVDLALNNIASDLCPGCGSQDLATNVDAGVGDRP